MQFDSLSKGTMGILDTLKKLSKQAGVLQRRQDVLNKAIGPPADRPTTTEGRMLPMMLDAAVPLWIHSIKENGGPQTPEHQKRLKELGSDESNLCLRMEYLLHKGPKPEGRRFCKGI